MISSHYVGTPQSLVKAKSGHIDYRPQYNLELVIDEGRAEDFWINISGEFSASILAEFLCNVNRTSENAGPGQVVAQEIVGRFPENPYYRVMWAGEIPIVMSVQTVFGVKISGYTQGLASMSAGVSLNKLAGMELRYINNRWVGGIGVTDSYAPTWQAEEIGASMNILSYLHASVSAQVNIGFCDVAGLSFVIQPNMLLDTDLDADHQEVLCKL